MKNTDTSVYTLEQIADARKVMDVRANLPDGQRPILMSILSAFVAGMETQQMLNGHGTEQEAEKEREKAAV